MRVGLSYLFHHKACISAAHQQLRDVASVVFHNFCNVIQGMKLFLGRICQFLDHYGMFENWLGNGEPLAPRLP